MDIYLEIMFYNLLNAEHRLCECLEKLTREWILASLHFPLKMDGWMTSNFTSFSAVFQSYEDDGRLIMKGCVQWNSVYG